MRRHLDPGKTLVRPLLPNFDVDNLKVRAARQNLIEHFGQNEGIDNVPAQLDCFGEHLQSLAEASNDASHGVEGGSRDSNFRRRTADYADSLANGTSTWSPSRQDDENKPIICSKHLDCLQLELAVFDLLTPAFSI